MLDFDERPDLGRENGVWDLGSAEAAELAKLAETTYRDVNIALANEFAQYAEHIGIDIAPVIDAANSQPYSHVHQPGLVGGHCIPVYPHFYLAGHVNARLPRSGREVNDADANRVVEQLDAIARLGGKTVAILGATYRGGVKETAFSGMFAVVEAVARLGGQARVHDPMLSDDELVGLGVSPYHLGEHCDVAIVQADHDEYRRVRRPDLPGCRLILDIRRIIDREVWGPDTDVVVLGDG